MDFSIKRKRHAVVWGIIDLLFALGMFGVYFFGEPTLPIVKIFILLSLVLYVSQLYLIFALSGKQITATLIFLLLFYLFQNGQLFLWACGIPFNDYYLMYFQGNLAAGAIFTSVCNLCAVYAAVLCCLTMSKERWKISGADRYDRRTVSTGFGVATILLAVVVIPLTMWKFKIALHGGYAAVREAEDSIPSVIGFMEYMFSPLGLAYIFYAPKRRDRWICVGILCLFYLLTALCGDRTSGISGLFVLSFSLCMMQEDTGKRRKFAVGLAAACLALSCFGYIIGYARVGDESYSIGIGDMAVGVISEIGFSCIPLLSMMSVVPGSESFLYGRGYLYSLVGGVLPASLDITGTVAKVNEQSRIFEEWQTQYFPNFDFGFGFSLNAESYINFGWFGPIAIFVVVFVIVYFLNSYKKYLSGSLFPKYVACILIFAWFTLPRRDSYYIWKAVVYFVLLVRIYMWFCVKVKQLVHGKKR